LKRFSEFSSLYANNDTADELVLRDQLHASNMRAIYHRKLHHFAHPFVELSKLRSEQIYTTVPSEGLVKSDATSYERVTSQYRYTSS